MGARESFDGTKAILAIEGSAVSIAAQYHGFLDKLLAHKGLSGDAQDALEDAKLEIGKIAKAHSNYVAESDAPREAIRKVIAELNKAHGDELKKVIRESEALTPEDKAEARSVLNGKGFANEPETLSEQADRQNKVNENSSNRRKGPDKGWKRPGSETADDEVFKEIEDGYNLAKGTKIRKPENAKKMAEDFATLLPKIEKEMEAMKKEALDTALTQSGKDTVDRDVTKTANSSLAHSKDYQHLREWKNFINERTQGLDSLAHPEVFASVGKGGMAEATAKRFLDTEHPKIETAADASQRIGLVNTMLGQVKKDIAHIENETFTQMFGNAPTDQQKQYARDHVLPMNEAYSALREQKLTLEPMVENLKGVKNALVTKEAIAADEAWYKTFDKNTDRVFNIADRALEKCQKAVDMKSKSIAEDVNTVTKAATQLIEATGKASEGIVEKTIESAGKNPEGVKALGKAVEGVIESTEVPIKALNGDGKKEEVKEQDKGVMLTPEVKDLVAQMKTSKSSEPAVQDAKNIKSTGQGHLLG